MIIATSHVSCIGVTGCRAIGEWNNYSSAVVFKSTPNSWSAN